MAKTYSRSALTGGSSDALDGIDGVGLVDGDRAITITSGWVYFHTFNATSTETESVPDVVTPDLNGSSGRWELVNVAQKEPILDDRRFFIQSTQPADIDSVAGDIWIDVS